MDACRGAGAAFSLAVTVTVTIREAIPSIDEDAWTPVTYASAVRDGEQEPRETAQPEVRVIFTDLEDSALAHLPSGKCTANAAWLTLAAAGRRMLT